MTKGADSIIYDYCMSDSSKKSKEYKETQYYVNQYANEGLRTLFLAQREMSKTEFDEFFEKVKQAKEDGD